MWHKTTTSRANDMVRGLHHDIRSQKLIYILRMMDHKECSAEGFYAVYYAVEE